MLANQKQDQTERAFDSAHQRLMASG